MNKALELRYMAECVWDTLAYLYDRLSLRKHLKLRVVNKDLVFEPETADLLRIPIFLNDLLDVMKNVFRRLQFTVFEQEEVVSYVIRGKVDVKRSAKYFPQALSVRRQLITIETPANLLLAATAVEVYERLLNVYNRLVSTPVGSAMQPLRDLAVRRISDALTFTWVIMQDPVVRQLLRSAKELVLRPEKLDRLEREVWNEARLRPREFGAYVELLKLRERLRKPLAATTLEGVKEALAIDLPSGKLYELYCFTKLLYILVGHLEVKNARLNQDERVIKIEARYGDKDMQLTISYNVVPKSVKSRVQVAKARGLLGDGVSPIALKGVPDTVIKVERGSENVVIIVDYKYSRATSYLTDARFKALAYLYEFDADGVVIMSPSPTDKGEEVEDEEVEDQSKFYTSIKSYGGARLSINKNEEGKFLVFAYIDPELGKEGQNDEIMRKIIEMMFQKIENLKNNDTINVDTV